MAPPRIRPYNFAPGKLSTSSFTRETETMYVHRALYPRSSTGDSSGGGGLATNTIIFIVVGVVCLLVILIGFYLVSRSHARPTAAPRVDSPHPQNSPQTPSLPSQRERNTTERWKVWKLWRHASDVVPQITVDTPTIQVTPVPAAVTGPSRIMPSRTSSKTYPPLTSRPTSPRRITSLSVTTSFTHSHITEEALNDFRLSAYDLDGDLEAEMLNSARGDIWTGHVLTVMEDGCRDVGMEEEEEAKEAQGDALFIIGGSAEGDVPPETITQSGAGDYEDAGAREKDRGGAEEDVIEDEVVGRQAFK